MLDNFNVKYLEYLLKTFLFNLRLDITCKCAHLYLESVFLLQWLKTNGDIIAISIKGFDGFVIKYVEYLVEEVSFQLEARNNI